ncbi:SCP-like protein [Ancylostoma caninum]|uniref:SCP-like protein n=1 Tax=Ancylostoma caninum TaxID=29170 RepID=A0A368GLY7_ANCCA|nr:SCP-like protein [Ancylostoma caninum]
MALAPSMVLVLGLLYHGVVIRAQTTAAPAATTAAPGATTATPAATTAAPGGTTAPGGSTAGATTTTGASTTTASALPSCTNAGMTDEVRTAYLDKHNNYRSSLAKGLEYNGNHGYAGKGTNIQKMKYDCDAEASAIRHANTCSGELSNPNTRPGLKENIIKIDKVYLSEKEAAEKASDRWWKELSMHGVRPDMLFTSAIRHRTEKVVTHWSKMAWHDNVRLGCGINKCSNFYFAVCHYGPGGNVVDEYIYNVGETCSSCPAGSVCDATTGLCA